MAPYYDSLGNWCSIWELWFTFCSGMSSNPYSRKSIWLMSPNWVPFIGNLTSSIILHTTLQMSWWRFLNVSVMTCFCLNRISFCHYKLSGDGTYMQSQCQGVSLGGILHKLGGLFELIWALHGLRIQCWVTVNNYYFDWGRLLGASTCNNGVVPIPLHGASQSWNNHIIIKEGLFPSTCHLEVNWWKLIEHLHGSFLNCWASSEKAPL